VDERKRSSKPQTHYVCGLNAGHTSTRETQFGKYKGINEEILPPKSDPATKYHCRRLGNLEYKDIGTKRPSKHLSPKLYGPFKVLEQKESMAYKLEISPRWKIHPCSQFPFWNLTDPQTDRSANSNPGIPLISRET